MNRFYWCDSALTKGEAVITSATGIRLYDGERKTHFDDGHLTLTSHRLLWRHESQSSSLGLNLELISLVEEEAGGFIHKSKLILHLSMPPHTQPQGPNPTSSYNHTKLSFRHGNVGAFHQSLRTALEDQAWQVVEQLPMGIPQGQAGGRKIRAGILGIERDIQSRQNEASHNINVAFEDLNKLMSFAKDMVALSKNISTKIKEHSGEVSADETTQFRSYLLSLGIDDPVTRETSGSDSAYHKQLAKEMAHALDASVKEAGGVMLLSEAYCRINRARGLSLISPEDALNACRLMKNLDLPLHMHTFQSGVQIVQVAGLDQEGVVKATKEVLDKYEAQGISANDFAQECGLPLLLAKERLLQAEQCAEAVRDESNEGLRFYPNLFFSKG